MENGCVFAPTLNTPDHIAVAEELCYALRAFQEAAAMAHKPTTPAKAKP